MQALELFIDPFLSRRGLTEHVHSAVTVHGRTRRVGELGWSIAGWLREQHAKRLAIAELERLSDGLLNDIGIQRGEIRAIVNRRWKWIERPSGPTAGLELRRVSTERLDKLPATASNDPHVDTAA